MRGKIEAGPFGNNAVFYTQRYWSVIPVQPNSKECAVVGYTGRDGEYPTRAQIEQWTIDYPAHNIAIRLPKDIIGIDVDAYGTKHGDKTLIALEEELGDLPHTYVITSRTDGASGIRLFRCDATANWKGSAGVGIDVLTWYHRYAVVSPSVHPDTKVEYEWYHEAGSDHEFQPATCPSYKDDIIPELPEAWVSHLRSGFSGNKSARMTAARHRQWLEENGGGKPCANMTATTSLWIDRIVDAGDGGGAHDAMLSGVKAVIGDSMAGHPGMSAELIRLRNTFYESISARRSRNDAESEWRRAVMGGVNLHRGGERETADPCADGSLDPKAFGPVRKNGQKVTAETFKAGHRQTDDRKFSADVDRAKYGMRVQQEARRALVSEHVAESPEIMELGKFMDMDVPPPKILVDGLIALEGNTLLVAQPKAGKTTLVHNLVRAVADSEKFLAEYKVRKIPDQKKIVLLDFEMHHGLLRAWLDDQIIENRERVAISSLYGCASSFNIMDPFCHDEWAGYLRDQRAGYIILDCLAPALAAIGVDENSNTEVGAWLDAMMTLVRDCGAYGMMIVHHTGRQGEHARGASRLEGWTSDNIRLTLQGAGEDDDGKFVRADRFLSARGRVAFDFTECKLEGGSPDDNRRLWVGGGTKAEVAAQRCMPDVIAFIETNPGTSKNAIEKNVTGATPAIRTVISQLINDGEVCNHGGSRTPSLYFHCKDKECPNRVKLKV